MRKVLVGLLVLWSVAAVANAANIGGQEVGVTVDATYTTKYIWRGFDLMDDKAAFQPSVDFDFGNGFSFNVWGSIPGSGGGDRISGDGFSAVNAEEWDYTLAYSSSINEGCTSKMDYTVGFTFFDFPDMASNDADTQEVFLQVSMPEICSIVTPHAAVYQMWPSEGSGAVHDYSGTIYAVGFTYGFTAEQAPELPMTFGWDIVYNDGTGADAVDSDWSHMVWSLSTSMTCPMTGASISPALFYQNSFEDTVNTEDEFWASISYSFSF
ncbi:MAG: hypothetical protein H8E62_05690 [Planctomycetes bacterium]|nr:hypothetical protein [Planctomycetota bacterium]